MSAFDWVAVVIIALSVLTAAAQGFFFELFSLGGTVFGFLLACWMHGMLAPWFQQYVKSPALADAAGFMTIFLLVLIMAGIAGKVTRWALKETGLHWVDRLLGAAFGLVRGLVVVTILVMAVASFMPDSPWLERSVSARYFLLSARVASWAAPSDLKQKFQNGLSEVRRRSMEIAAPNAKK